MGGRVIGALRWLVLVVGVGMMVAAESAAAKGFTEVVFVGANGNRTYVQGTEAEISTLLNERRDVLRPRGGYLDVFFVGPNHFPANPARYFPDVRCMALDWPEPGGECRRVGSRFGLMLLFIANRKLAQLREPPTRLIEVRHRGRDVRAIGGSIRLAFSGRSYRVDSRRQSCYRISARWQGPEAAARPERFELCADGVLAGGKLYPLKRGAWSWLGTNVGGP